jgi:tetratricopeptide (TPR) repeat protein
MAHVTLGLLLHHQRRAAEAEAPCRKAIALQPESAEAHALLGLVLLTQGKWAEAEAAYRQAIRLKPDYPSAHNELGIALGNQGRFAEGLAALRKAQELGPRLPGGGVDPANIQKLESLARLDARLAKLLSGEEKAAGAPEQLALADFCWRHKKLPAAAARFYAAAFAADPERAPRPPHRYNAAGAAAWAGCGQGKDGARLDAGERTRLRRQALDWLRADLATLGKGLEDEPDKAPAVVQWWLRRYQRDAAFAGVRGEALGKLPEAERQAWQQLWADVEQTLKRADRGDTKGSKKRPAK